MSATPTRKRLAVSASKARSVKKTRLAQSRAMPKSSHQRQASSGLTKFASTFSGGTAVGLAAAVITPSAPIVAAIAMLVGLVGSGLLVKRYG